MKVFHTSVQTALIVFALALVQATMAAAETAWLTPERWDKMLDSAAVESPKLLIYLLIAGAGWAIGARLTVLWSRHQKRAEQDLDAARNFHALYGEFFALWKLWNYYLRDVGSDALPQASRWALLDRACASEAKLEATLVRLASHRALSDKEIETLGRFRQYYQQLRECIRDNVPLAWDHAQFPAYMEFKKLAPQVAAIVAGDDDAGREQLIKITSNVYELPNRRPRSPDTQPAPA